MPLGASRLSYLALPQVEAVVQRTALDITAFGDAQTYAVSPYFKTGASSLKLDGTGDYLTFEDVPELDMGEFTVECWFRVANTGAALIPLVQIGDFLFYIGQSGGPVFAIFKSGNNRLLSSVQSLSNDTWYHVAFQRDSSNNLTCYLDGVLIDDDSSYSPTITSGINYIGRYTTFYLNGYLDEVRISNVKRYSSTFTPNADGAHINDANTVFLSHMYGPTGGTTFYDDNGTREQLGFLPLGNTQIDTAQKEYGTASALFDGSGDYLRVGQTDNFDFGTSGDFTFEGWFRITTGGNRGVFHLSSSYLPSQTTGLALSPRTDYGGYVVYHGTTTSALPVGAPATNTWIHFAITRESGTMNVYVDGTRITTRSDSYDYNFEYLAIGGYYSTSFLWNGHIDEFRVSNTARYTGASHTVPTSAFVNDANTVMLLHMDGTDGSTLFIDDNGST